MKQNKRHRQLKQQKFLRRATIALAIVLGLGLVTAGVILAGSRNGTPTVASTEIPLPRRGRRRSRNRSPLKTASLRPPARRQRVRQKRLPLLRHPRRVQLPHPSRRPRRNQQPDRRRAPRRRPSRHLPPDRRRHRPPNPKAMRGNYGGRLATASPRLVCIRICWSKKWDFNTTTMTGWPAPAWRRWGIALRKTNWRHLTW